MRMDQRCVGVGGLSLMTSTEINVIARTTHGDRHEGGQPSAVIDAKKCFRSSSTRVDGRSLQTDSTRIMRDQKKHAGTEGEMQMGTTRADGC